MDGYFTQRSPKLVVSVVGILLLGIFFAYALPTTTFTDDSYGTAETESFGLSEISARVQLFGKGWTYDIARAGIVLALVMALVLQTRQQTFQRFSILIGCAMGLVFPIYLQSLLEPGDSLGSGMILFSIACIAAGVLPWIPGVSEPESTLFGDLENESDAQSNQGIVSVGSRSTNSHSTSRLAFKPELKLFPTSGVPGTTVDASAAGFPSRAIVTFKWLRDTDTPVLLGAKEASITGEAHIRFSITAEAGDGFYRLIASNGVQSVTAGFFVKSEVSSTSSVAS